MPMNKTIRLLAQISLLVMLTAGLVDCGKPQAVTPASTGTGRTGGR